MSLLKRNSPRKTRARKEQVRSRVGETKSPTLGPVVEKMPDVIADQQQLMIDEYSYTPEPKPEPEPVQLNRAMEPSPEPAPAAPARTTTFNLYDLSFFCEERIYNVLYLPMNIKEKKLKEITLKNVNDRLSVFSEYTQEVVIGAFKDNLHFYRGEILIPEEFQNVTGFMRKFLKIERVSILYDTGEVLSQETEFCNFWLERAPRFFEPKNIPLDRPQILDEDVCFDCNLSCLFRHRQQMTK